MTKYEPLIPLEDLHTPGGLNTAAVSVLPADGVEEFLRRQYGVTVVLDHRNRRAVSLADAYKVRDARQAAADELQAEYTARMAENELVDAWQRARDQFWSANYMRTLRAQPLSGADHAARVNRARAVLGERILAAEKAAGIPKGIQERLSWPQFSAPYRVPDQPGDRPEDYAYVPPKRLEGEF
jgi:hypothetical protein